MAIIKPAKLTVTLNVDTGSTKDKITYNATVKLSKLDANNTLEWLDSTTGAWESIDTSLLSSIDVKKQTALLNIADLVSEDFVSQTLNFRQVNTAGTVSDATSLTFTYDTTAPELIEIIPPDVDTILNKGTSVVRITSNEKLTGLDAKDFSLSSTLASIKSVKEVKVSDEEWAYDVTISAASKGNGDVSLMFSSTAAATDIAGNAIDFSAFIEAPLVNFWIGNDSLLVSLVEDTGPSFVKNANKDGITHNGEIKLNAIKPDALVEFRIKAGSASLPEGLDEWLTIDDLSMDGSSATVDLAYLYELAGLSLDDMPMGGWKDTFEFHQVNVETDKASMISTLTFTYDVIAPTITDSIADANTLLNGRTTIVHLYSDEQLQGIDKADFAFNDTKLASIQSVSAGKFNKESEQWVYDVTVLATKGTVSGATTLKLADKASITDLAGNAADASNFAEGFADLWIGNDSLLVSLVEDTGPSIVKNANKDGITYNGEIKLGAIKPDALVEFRIKAGSASLPEGLDEWLAIDDLNVNGSSAVIDVAYLYELVGLSSDDMLVGGWKDTFEFHQVNGDRTSLATALTFTYDLIAPTLTDSRADADTLLNGKTTVVHLSSDEQLQGIDKADFTFTDTKLATVQSVSAGKFNKESEQWVYDVTVLATKGTVSGATTLKLADKASITDLAGNAADASNFAEGFADFWVGKYDDKLSVSLVEDTSSGAVNSNKDGITHNGMIKLNGIKSDTVVEFRIKPGSASLPDGSGDEWMAIDLGETGISATLDSVYLYDLVGIWLDEMPPTGWKDTFEFRQVNQTTGKISEATPITFTYDAVAAYLDYIEMDSGDSLPNGETTIVHLYSSEKLQGLDKSDFILSDPSLASIKSVSGGRFDNDAAHWIYDVTITSTSADLSGLTTLQLSDNASVTDIAGNAFWFDGYDIPVGEFIQPFTATLTHDHGVSDEDNTSYHFGFKFKGITDNTWVEFRLAEGSDSAIDGVDWATIPSEKLLDLTSNNDTSIFDWDLYDLLGINYWEQMPASGLNEIWEFRLVDDAGQVLESAEPLYVNYDRSSPNLVSDESRDPIQNGQTRIIQFFAEEQIFGLNKDTIQVNNSALASITDIQEYQLDDGLWAYDVFVKATTNGQGELTLSLPSTSTATDAAGNRATLMNNDYNYAIWVGENPDAPVASLVNDAGVKGDNITNNNQLRIYGITSTDTLEFRFKENSTIYPLLNEEERQDWRSVNDIRYISGNVALVESVMDPQGLEYWSNEYPAGFTQAYEFRKVDADGNISAVSDEFMFTFDRTAPEIDVIMDNLVIPNAGSAVVRLLSTERLMNVDKNAIWLEDPQKLASVTNVNEVSMTNDQWAYDITLQVGTNGNGIVRGGLYWSIDNIEIATDLAGNHAYNGNFTFWAGSNPPDMTATLSYDSGESDSDNITNDVVFRLDAFDHSKTQEVRLKSGSEFAPNGTDWFSIPADFFIYNQGFSKSVAGSELYRLLNNDEYLNWETIPVDGLTDIWEFRQQGSSSTSSVTVTYDPIAAQITQMETPAIIGGETGLIQFTSNEQLVDLNFNNFYLYGSDGHELAYLTDIQETQISNNEWQYSVSVATADTGYDEIIGIVLQGYDIAGNGYGGNFHLWTTDTV